MIYKVICQTDADFDDVIDWVNQTLAHPCGYDHETNAVEIPCDTESEWILCKLRF
jgi:hypothetical protein